MDTAKAVGNTVVNTVEGGVNLMGGALPGAPDYLPFMNGLRTQYDTPAFGEVLEFLMPLKGLPIKGRPVGVGQVSAEAAADAALASGRTGGAASELRVGDHLFTDVSTGGVKRTLNPQVQEALDKIPQNKRAPWHGHCAEPGCLSQAINSGVNPAGGTSRAVNIGTSGKGHGTSKPTCQSCKQLLDIFGVKYDR